MRQLFPIIALLSLALVPLSAHAQPARPSERAAGEDETIYYQGVGKAEAKRLFQEATGRTISDNALQALPNVVLPIEDDIWFLGAPQGRKCDESVRAEMLEITGGFDGGFALLVTLAQSELDELQYDSAREYFGLVARAIPCASELLSSDSLAQLFLYFGINAYYTGQHDLARSYFRQSVQLSGRPQWDDSYAPDPQEIYLAAADEVEAYGRIDFAYRLPGLNLHQLYIDGEDLLTSPEATGALRVLPGTHVIQWQRAEGELQTRVVEVPRGAQLVSAQGLQEILSMHPKVGDDSSLTGLVQEGFLARKDGSTSILVVDEETQEPKFSYTYDRKGNGGGEGAVKYHLGEPEDDVQRKANVRYRPIEARFGGAYVLGTTLSFSARADFWLKTWAKGSIGIQFGADIAFTGYVGLTAEDNRLSIMPAPSAGLRAEFRPNRLIKPYVFVLGRVHIGVDPRVTAGPVAGGGATFMFPPSEGGPKGPKAPDGVAGLWLEAGGGPMFSSGQPQGTFWAAAGLTFRPFSSR